MQIPIEDDCFAIRQAARYVSHIYDRHLAQVGLTITQFSILLRLRRTSPQTASQLADSMVMDRTTLVRAIQPLQRDGLLSSAPSERDRRALSIRLTELGVQKLASAKIPWHAAQEEFEERFGAQRAALLRQELFALTSE
ncbi:MarR family transcriptional regulator [Trinickia terrae]|uniref:MarR family transcriptional regulator n=1 Tax=Trinickia terrae TaxID=2571161 RepID=A0A4U1I518_9BURK|nr:MarR family transcriptional regulator [Trinickia terrae]TKC88398.1 MarR family transcriptional regulator [Trinickia terrae]